MTRRNRNVLAISILSAFLGLSVAFNLIQRAETSELEESKDALKNGLIELYTQLDSARAANDSLLQVIADYQFVVDSLDNIVEENEDQIDWLNGQLEKLEEEIVNITPDTAYVYLKEEYATDDTVDIYDFSGGEVLGIYKDVSRLPYLDGTIVAQSNVIEAQKKQLSTKEEIIKSLGQGNEAKQELIERLYDNLADSTVQLDQSEADNRHLRKTLRLWKTGSLTAGGALVLLLILL